VAFAAQRFRTRMGRNPARLAELVPSDLPAVPTDFANPPAELGYAIVKTAGGAERPMVFLGGTAADPVPAEPTYAWHATGQRQYRDLTRLPRVPALPAGAPLGPPSPPVQGGDADESAEDGDEPEPDDGAE
jgi:hypothetical protein